AKDAPHHLQVDPRRRRAAREDADLRHREGGPLGEDVDVAEDPDLALPEEFDRGDALVRLRARVDADRPDARRSEALGELLRLLDALREEEALLSWRVLEIRLERVLRDHAGLEEPVRPLHLARDEVPLQRELADGDADD